MQGYLEERQVLVLAYLKAQAEGDEESAAKIRSFADEDPELARMLDAEDEESARRASRPAPFLHLVASLFDRLFGR